MLKSRAQISFLIKCLKMLTQLDCVRISFRTLTFIFVFSADIREANTFLLQRISDAGLQHHPTFQGEDFANMRRQPIQNG